MGDKHKIVLSDDLKRIIPGRGHRSNSNNNVRAQFVDFFNKKLMECNINMPSIFGTPKEDPKKTDSQTCYRCRAEEKKLDGYGEDL
ncbi:hypothetical protein [Nitrosomonas sp. Nm33]|uniref:hypothetical protein n=1 Tax=Nitrosomonas sp. Nm33 TaxID=133724 RepID=UPI00089C7AB7|nr:hypothetical protein [Nitrosomonas sp. Nm33]SDY45705.1 hypothetical protein SAMN05421755_102331 [Nitrosomonas sp. Nm33]